MTPELSAQIAFDRVAADRRVRLVRFWRSVGRLDLYLVDSATDPDRCFVVAVRDADAYTCACPAKHHAACWHRAAVAVARAERLAAGKSERGPVLWQLAPAVARPEAAA